MLMTHEAAARATSQASPTVPERSTDLQNGADETHRSGRSIPNHARRLAASSRASRDSASS